MEVWWNVVPVRFVLDPPALSTSGYWPLAVAINILADV